MCESSGRWDIDTGNGYYGGLQIQPSTWDEAGGTDYAPLPHQATRREQITVAEKILRMQGWGAWPQCAPTRPLLRADHHDLRRPARRLAVRPRRPVRRGRRLARALRDEPRRHRPRPGPAPRRHPHRDSLIRPAPSARPSILGDLPINRPDGGSAAG
ncbi:transglycosylase family protein [Yinghuangia aomiensis]